MTTPAKASAPAPAVMVMIDAELHHADEDRDDKHIDHRPAPDVVGRRDRAASARAAQWPKRAPRQSAMMEGVS